MVLSTEKEEALYDYYYNKKNFFGRDKLYALMSKHHPELRISQSDTLNWLKKQETYQLNLRAHKKTGLNSTVLNGPFIQWGIDLIDMRNITDNGYEWILTVIDLFSKRGWAVAIKQKNNVVQGLTKIFKETNVLPKSIRSDNGKEFVDKNVKEFLSKNNIKQVFSSTYTPQSNGNVERFNAIIKGLIRRSRDEQWVKLLPTLVNNYNNSYQRIIKMTPMQAQEAENKDIVHENIRKGVGENAERLTDFEVGDIVRVKLHDTEKTKDGFIWGNELHTIIRINKANAPFRKNTYQVSGLKRNIDYADMQLINGDVQNKKTDVEKFVISAILRPMVEDNQKGYYVRFRKQGKYFVREADLKIDAPKVLKAFVKKYNVLFYQRGARWVFSWDGDNNNENNIVEKTVNEPLPEKRVRKARAVVDV